VDDGLNGLQRLTLTDVQPAANVAARAFYEYPLSVFFVPDASKRLKKQANAFGGLIRSGIEYGDVYATSPKMEGVAVWFHSDNHQMVMPRPPFIKRLAALIFADRAVTQRQIAFGRYAGEIRKRVVPGRHWYLQLLAVDPAFQGKGFSSRLVKPMLARADKEGLPCYLETQAAKNVTLYEHFGFRVGEEGLIPGSNVHSWAMVREHE
jgi:GNAT superfamily N-acetyltransferase